MATPPISQDDAYLVLSSVAGTKAVLVGGQAVAWWAGFYPAPGGSESPITSKDVDLLGDAEAAKRCAAALGGRVHFSEPWESIPVTAAQVVFTDSAGYQRSVDFLINVCGVKNARDIHVKAAAFEHEGGDLYVMDPLTCLRSRIANIRQLGRRGAQSIAQARAAVRIAREWMLDPFWHPKWRDRLRWIESAFRYSYVVRDAREVAVMPDVNVDAFAAITRHESLPAKFNEIRYPQMQEWISERRAHDAAGNGP